MDFVSARTIVGSHGWLSLTPPSFRDAVLGQSRLLAVRAGETIFQVGDPPGGLYGLLSGVLGVSIAPGESGPYLAHFAQPGTWLGEGAVVTGRPRRVGLAATRACRMLHLPLHALQEILARDPAAWQFIALLTTLHLDVSIGAADDLMIRDHAKRLVAILLRLGGCRMPGTLSEAPIDVHVNQNDLAHMANVARTTAGSLLRSLAADGHVEHAYRSIRILAPDALRAMLAQE
jgi:CRP/FNR family transcriptional regulator, cyclic AMP receptor protein